MEKAAEKRSVPGYQHSSVPRTGLDHTRLNLGHTNRRVDELLHHGDRESVQGVLGRTVDGATGVSLATRDRAELDDVPRVVLLEV